jgi:hypothetical protein
MGSPTGRESYGDGGPVVVAGVVSRDAADPTRRGLAQVPGVGASVGVSL